jgi:hypothetical protein
MLPFVECLRPRSDEADGSPRNQGFHYNQNAETYMLVGEALGKGMLELLKANE